MPDLASLDLLDALISDASAGMVLAPQPLSSASATPSNPPNAQPAKSGKKGAKTPEEIEAIRVARAAAKAEAAHKTPTMAAKPTAAKPTAAKPAVAEAKAAAAASKSPAPASQAAASDSASLPPTEALYQTDTYLFTSSASVLSVAPLDGDAGGWCVVLDSTCFHPQGGGQPADSGLIRSVNGSPESQFAVSMVAKDKAGVVRHQGPAEPNFKAGDKVTCHVDEASRVKNARVHSAGHLIDVAMTNSGCTLKPTKGYHFTPGSYVEYEGKLEAAERDALVPKLQAAMNELIDQAVPTKVVTVDASELGAVCPPNSLPSDPKLWGTGWVRVVCVGGQGCPCGGTHVSDTKELGAVKVEAIKSKGKVTRVSYSMLD